MIRGFRKYLLLWFNKSKVEESWREKSSTNLKVCFSNKQILFQLLKMRKTNLKNLNQETLAMCQRRIWNFLQLWFTAAERARIKRAGTPNMRASVRRGRRIFIVISHEQSRHLKIFFRTLKVSSFSFSFIFMCFSQFVKKGNHKNDTWF